MASAAPPLTQDDSNFFRNNKAADEIIPAIFTRILNWGCKKEPEDTYEEFLKKKLPPNDREKYMIRFRADRSKLKNKDSNLFDVTFMFKLIPAVCGGIAKGGSTVWLEGDETKLECCLQKLKDLRNDVTHEPKGAAISPGLLKEVEKLLVKALRLAGSLFSIEQETVKKVIEDLQKKVKDQSQAMMTDKEKRMEQAEKRIKIDGRAEMKIKNGEGTIIVLPFCRTKIPSRDVYHSNKLSIENAEDKKSITCKELFTSITTKYYLIQGQPGSGKSTLLRRMKDDFLDGKSPESFIDVRSFAFVLLFECRATAVKRSLNLVQLSIPNTLVALNREEAFEILRKLPCLLLIDGIDEMNKNSRSVFEDLKNSFGVHGKSTFVITSRPGDAFENLKQLLNKEGIDHIVMFIEPICDRDEQIKFLERYQKSIPGINAQALTKAFNSLNQSCFVHFDYPLYLALFWHLFHSSPKDDAIWKNECSIIRQIVDLSKKMIEERLEMQQVPNKTLVSRKLMEAAGELSLQLIIQDQLTIKKIEHDEMWSEMRIEKLKVEFQSILSCIFSSKPKKDTYEYLHKSQAEFMAAQTIVTKLRECRNASISQQIEATAKNTKPSNESKSAPEVQEKQDAKSSTVLEWMKKTFMPALPTVQLQRFLNVLRFIVMELVEDEKNKKLLMKCLKEIKEITSTLSIEMVGAEFWAKLSLSCPNSVTVKMTAAKAANVTDRGMTGDRWEVTTQRQITSATFNLRKKPPKDLIVKLPRETSSSPTLMLFIGAVAEYYKNDFSLLLEESYNTFQLNDDILTRLSSAQCKLIEFTGCITSRTAQIALTDAVSRVKNGPSADKTVKLHIAVLNPRKHKLSALKGTKHELFIRTKLDAEDTDRRLRPLPNGRYDPQLTVVLEEYQETSNKLVDLIEDLAPEDRRYRYLYLQSWQGSDDCLNEVVKGLDVSGVRTIYNRQHSSPCWLPTGMPGKKREKWQPSSKETGSQRPTNNNQCDRPCNRYGSMDDW